MVGLRSLCVPYPAALILSLLLTFAQIFPHHHRLKSTPTINRHISPHPNVSAPQLIGQQMSVQSLAPHRRQKSNFMMKFPTFAAKVTSLIEFALVNFFRVAFFGVVIARIGAGAKILDFVDVGTAARVVGVLRTLVDVMKELVLRKILISRCLLSS